MAAKKAQKPKVRASKPTLGPMPQWKASNDPVPAETKSKATGIGEAPLSDETRKFLGINTDVSAAAAEGTLVQLDMDLLDESPTNARKRYNQQSLSDLSTSIEQTGGLIQAIVVRPKEDGRYEIVAGHRRFRANKMANRPTIEAVVRDLDDKVAAVTQIVENDQRDDLSAYERAVGYDAAINGYFEGNAKAFGIAIGKSQSEISKVRRVTTMAEIVQETARDASVLDVELLRLLDNLHKKDESAAKVFCSAILAGKPVGREAVARALEGRGPATTRGPIEPEPKWKSASVALEQAMKASKAIDEKGKAMVTPPSKKGRPFRVRIDVYDEQRLESLLAKLGVEG